MKKNQNVSEFAQLGNPVLRLQALPVEEYKSSHILRIIKKMQLSLLNSSGVGLAAPQIFESVCIIVVASKPSKRYPLAPEMDPIIMINPNFKVLSQTIKKDWEGCLSIPGIRALVPRYEKVQITFFDQQGAKQELIAEDFVARVFQHEYDHLNGLVYLDRVDDNKDIISESEFQKIIVLNNS